MTTFDFMPIGISMNSPLTSSMGPSIDTCTSEKSLAWENPAKLSEYNRKMRAYTRRHVQSDCWWDVPSRARSRTDSESPSSTCPSASSSASTTPESSVPCTPVEEIPMDILSPFVPIVHVAGVDSEVGEEDEKASKGSIGRAFGKLASAVSVKRTPSVGKTRGSRIREMIKKVKRRTSKSFQRSEGGTPDEDASDDGDDAGDAAVPYTPILPGAYMHLTASQDSMASIAAVHGSPLETDETFTFFPQAQEDSLPTVPMLVRAASSAAMTSTLSTLQRALLFLPYTLLVGLAPLLFPQHLSHITFSSAFGYVSRPHTAFQTFGHHLRMLPYHFGVALCTLVLLARLSAAFAVSLAVLALSAALYAWRDFSLSGAGSGLDLGADDRMSIYWLLKGVYFGRNDLVCSMEDFERICAASDGVDVNEERMRDDESEFDMLMEGNEVKETEGVWDENGDGQGLMDCTIRVAGYNKEEPGSEMRIIVQCVE